METRFFTDKDMQSLCRACAGSEDLNSLFRTEELVQNFTNLTGITVQAEDDLPKSICNKCLIQLNEFSQFRKQIIMNNIMFVQSIEKLNSIKTNKHTEKQTDRFEIETLLIKDESEVKVEVEEMDLDDHLDNDITYDIEEKTHKDTRKNIKEKKRQPKVIRTPRTVIQVEPEKITTLILTKDEQIRRQKAEAQRTENRSMPFKCGKCFKGFNYERKLASHVEKYHKPNSEFECDVCNRTMSNAASLSFHVKKHEFVYECNICRASFVEKIRAIYHYQNTHEGISREYPCPQCDRVFYNRSTLNGHIRNHHPVGERPRCEQCNKTFVSKDSLQDHMLIHTGEKNYSCHICGAKFRLRQCARVHLVSHTGVRAYVCTCGAAFKSKAARAQHRHSAGAHMAQEDKAKNTCSTCGRQFSTRYALKKHSHTHAPKRSEVTKRAKHHEAPPVRCVCHYCGRGFSARRTLENHILVHTGARPHACAACPARFAQRATLRNHERARHRPANTQSGISNIVTTK